MTVRVGLFVRVAFGAALAVLAGAFAEAQTAVPGQDEMNVEDQPGYQPTPEQEQLTGTVGEAGGVLPHHRSARHHHHRHPGPFPLSCCRATTARFATASALAASVSTWSGLQEDFAQAGMARTGPRRRK